jgi:hypothetical protein
MNVAAAVILRLVLGTLRGSMTFPPTRIVYVALANAASTTMLAILDALLCPALTLSTRRQFTERT